MRIPHQAPVTEGLRFARTVIREIPLPCDSSHGGGQVSLDRLRMWGVPRQGAQDQGSYPHGLCSYRCLHQGFCLRGGMRHRCNCASTGRREGWNRLAGLYQSRRVHRLGNCATICAQNAIFRWTNCRPIRPIRRNEPRLLRVEVWNGHKLN